jgi:hypothetical protein
MQWWYAHAAGGALLLTSSLHRHHRHHLRYDLTNISDKSTAQPFTYAWRPSIAGYLFPQVQTRGWSHGSVDLTGSSPSELSLFHRRLGFG